GRPRGRGGGELLRGVLPGVCGAARQGPGAAGAKRATPLPISVPSGGGAPADTLARLLGEHMERTLGQSFIVENVTGAAGSLGVARVVRAAPDGQTIGIGHLGTHVFNGALYNLQYDLVNDLEPIALLPANGGGVVAKKAVPGANLTGLMGWLKANPDQAPSATAGIGSVAHLASIYFQDKTGVALRIVPYRGGAVALNDVIAGHVTLMFDQL